MDQRNNNKIITQIILGHSIVSVRIIVALFVICSAVMKLLFDKYLPDIIDLDILRWTIIALGILFFFSTFYKYQPTNAIPYLSFFLYLLTIIYVVYFALINHFNPSAVIVLILVMGAGTVIINSLTYYGIQSGIIFFSSLIVFYSNELANENIIAFFSLILAMGVFATVIIIRLRLRSSVGLSYSFLDKLQVLSIIANRHGDIVFVSPSVKTVLGYEPKELLRQGWWMTSHLAKGWISHEHILNYPNLISKEIVEMESSLVTKDGRTVWLNWANSILPNGNYMGIALDVTKYKEK